MILSIDGNIGSGKSTLFNSLREYFSDEHNCGGKKIIFIDEPVGDWELVRDENDKTVLECFYENPEKHAFSFQMLAYISRLSKLLKIIKGGEYDIIITERCVYSDRNVFAKMLYDGKKMSLIEWKIYELWFDNFLEELPDIYFIYLKTTPELCSSRIKMRNRIGENISLDYLIGCNAYHEKWMKNISEQVITLDGDKDKSCHFTYINIIKEHIM